MGEDRVKLTDKQRREMLWYAYGVDQPVDYEGRKRDQQKALAAKGLINLSEDGDTGYLTNAGLRWLEGDPEAAELIAIYRRVTKKRDELARALVAQIESALSDDLQFASLFTKAGFVTVKHLGTAGGEAYTRHQIEGAFSGFIDCIEATKRRIEDERRDQARRDEAARHDEYIRQHGYLNHAQSAATLGLNEYEFRLAFERQMIKQARIPGVEYSSYFKQCYYDPSQIALTDEQRAILKKDALLTSWQAAERLGIDIKKFDRIKKGRINFFDTYPTNSDYPGYLWRQGDVDSLKEFI